MKMDRGDVFGMYALSHQMVEHLVCTAYNLDPAKTIIRQEDDGTIVAREHWNRGSYGYRDRTITINFNGEVDGEEDGGC